ncbi:MAG: M15 family metallopeptidase [Porticoccaceae bacterium]|nr:M15 family metallopeptidase [Porticoccaceae bacterium]
MNPNKLSVEQLTGQATDLLAPLDGDIVLHRDVIPPYLNLRQLAAKRGIDLRVASGYRSFDRQRHIWNCKVSGQRPVLDTDSTPLDITRLSDKELVFAILRWSALPGASRHHWGTDMDIWNGAAVDDNYRLQLTPEEYGCAGPFFSLAQWLATAEVEALGFVRPYHRDFGGVAPEAWHLSFAPVAADFERALSPDILAAVIKAADVFLKDTVLQHLDEIYHRFVVNRP